LSEWKQAGKASTKKNSCPGQTSPAARLFQAHFRHTNMGVFCHQQDLRSGFAHSIQDEKAAFREREDTPQPNSSPTFSLSPVAPPPSSLLKDHKIRTNYKDANYCTFFLCLETSRGDREATGQEGTRDRIWMRGTLRERKSKTRNKG